jgi:hypothetical protein
MTQFQAPNEVLFQFHGECGSLKIEVHNRRWGVMHHGGDGWDWRETPPLERDDLFITQAQAFLDGVEGRPSLLSTFDEGVQTLKFNQAALHSVHVGMPITIA